MSKPRADARSTTTSKIEPSLLTKAAPPGEADLVELLGRAKRSWDAFLAEAGGAGGGAAAEWKRYAGKTGWRLILRRKGRNLAYLRPEKGRFLVSLAFSEKALEAAERAGVAPEILAAIRASPRLPEGRAARIEVASASDAAIAAELVAIKAAN